MVVFIDLDEAEDPSADPLKSAGFALPRRQRFTNNSSTTTTACAEAEDHGQGDPKAERPNLNLNTFSEALGCYPIITVLASNIDLNTLHHLSRTCRQIRANLLPYCHRLKEQTLRCSHEPCAQDEAKPGSPGTAAAPSRWPARRREEERMTSGKVSSCARDCVRECRRCGRVVCRNCIIKRPPTPRFPLRLRRLCPTCLAAPIFALTRSSSTTTGSRSLAPQDPCICPYTVHICSSGGAGACGAKLAEADTIYARVWTWRTRYTTYLGGLGTGIGEGNEGVKCARGADCLGALEVEVEFECHASATAAAAGGSSSSSGLGDEGNTAAGGGGGDPAGDDVASSVSLPPAARQGGHDSPSVKEGAGYWNLEVEGLGGVVKKKVRKRERVGGTVRESEDACRGGEALRREKDGEERAWCAWCHRVVPGRDDVV